MQFAAEARETEQKMSPSIRAALVDSLFQSPSLLFVGAVCAAIAATMTAIKTGSAWLWPCVLILVATGAARALDMRRYVTRRSGAVPFDPARWEIRYQIAALSYAGSLGIWCAATLLLSDDAIAHLICITVTLCYVSAGAGRTYGRPWIYHLQVLIVFLPLVLAMFSCRNPYYLVLALLLIVCGLALKQISTGLQNMFVRALLGREREAALAHQFDTALNNMPQGLCMFAADGRLAVVNHRFSQMMKLPDDMLRSGVTAPEIIEAGVRAQAISAADGKSILAEISAQGSDLITSDGGEGRSLSWKFQSMEDGGIVVLLEDITERCEAEARIIRLARYDDLTGLPNRVNFRDEIEHLLARQLRAGQLSALLFIDLDHFKQVNDTLGHPCGDQLLCAAASRLREILRPEDFVARSGGDEFVVFQPNIRSNDEAADLARRIVDRLSARYEIDNHLVEIGASVGIALTLPGISSADILLKNADMALFQAKADGRKTFCFFRDEMAQTVAARRVLELDLRKALVNEEFELFYQPLVNLKSGKITTCEALLRWNHPQRGMVSPADIIPVAEEMGLIIALGRWILRKACMECRNWPEGVSVAVNFAPQQFHQRDVLGEVRDALERAGLPAHRLEIEITESSLLCNTELTQEVLSQLRGLGVRISLDDFGTGYSSLSYLTRFPLQKVKIDRSFLEGIEADRPLMLLRGVARLSADLGMAVVVEGIETAEQLELVRADGTVTEAQGYLFSRPVPASRLYDLLRVSHSGRDGDVPISKLPLRQTG